jgi:hypothetical protein
MNSHNSKGEPHGIWEYSNRRVNYHNGEKHGGYENYWDDKFEIIFCRGYYNMGERNNMWVWFDMCGKSLYKKEFYL